MLSIYPQNVSTKSQFMDMLSQRVHNVDMFSISVGERTRPSSGIGQQAVALLQPISVLEYELIWELIASYSTANR